MKGKIDFSKVDFSKRVPCQVREIGLSCYGCCGSSDFGGKREVLKDLEENSFEFEKIMRKNKLIRDKLVEFRDRFPADGLPPSGVCFNLVEFKDGCIGCPLHHLINEVVEKDVFEGTKEDLREFPCDVNYECKTFKLFEKMDSSQRKAYFEYLQDCVVGTFENSYEYSMNVHDGIYIEKFLKKKI